MGFRNGAYCTAWEIDPKSSTWTKVRISINRKNKDTGEYEQDFGGYVDFVGTAAAQKAAKLQPRTRFRLGDVEVTTTYNKEKKVEYTNFKVYSFDLLDDNNTISQTDHTDPQPNVDGGEGRDPRLPF